VTITIIPYTKYATPKNSNFHNKWILYFHLQITFVRIYLVFDSMPVIIDNVFLFAILLTILKELLILTADNGLATIY
jgi:hypothetical protein